MREGDRERDHAASERHPVRLPLLGAPSLLPALCAKFHDALPLDDSYGSLLQSIDVDVKAQILDVATRRFAAQGYGGTSLSAIADEVGIRKASLLYHFASKDELHRSVLDQVLLRWNEVLPRLLAAAASADRFDALLHETVRFFAEDPDRARLILRETLDNPDTMRGRLLAAVAPWLSVIAGYIRRGQETGEVRAEADPEAYLLHVIHLVVGGLAISDTLGIVLSADGASSDIDRLTRELERIARVSLFTDAGLERTNGRRAGARAGSH